MRRARGAGTAGLAGMAAVRELGAVRLLRPLLDAPRERLSATLMTHGQAWIEDPSNIDPRFERARLRASASAQGPDPAAGAARVDHERSLARLAGHAARVHPAGYVILDSAALRDATNPLAHSLVARAVTCVSGGVYPPRGARLARLVGQIRGEELARNRTLGGCVVGPGPGREIVIARERVALASVPHRAGGSVLWDGRFRLDLPDPERPDWRIDALWHAGEGAPDGAGHPDYAGLPRPARFALPGLFAGDRLVARPVFRALGSRPGEFSARFVPGMPLCGAVFGYAEL